jgi:hypothetical protein
MDVGRVDSGGRNVMKLVPFACHAHLSIWSVMDTVLGSNGWITAFSREIKRPGSDGWSVKAHRESEDGIDSPVASSR